MVFHIGVLWRLYETGLLKDIKRISSVSGGSITAGQLALAYKVYRCWVSEFQAAADLDANANAVLIQSIKLENEGWERDTDVVEPAEPSFTEPAI